MDQDDTNMSRAVQVREIPAIRAKERRLDALHQLKEKKTKARVQMEAEGETQCQCVECDMEEENVQMWECYKKSDLNEVFEDKPVANVSNSEEDEDEGKWELSNTDYVQEWLHKHCCFDEQAWSAVMKGVEATSEAAQYQCLAKPDLPASNFVLDGAEYTFLQTTCSKKFVLALTHLNKLGKAHEDMLGRLAFPNRMVMQHMTYIIRAFQRRMYFRLQGKSHREQEVMMRKVHYAMQGIIHRHFKKGLDTLVHFEKVQDKMYGDCMDDSFEDDEEGPSDDDSSDESSEYMQSKNKGDGKRICWNWWE